MSEAQAPDNEGGLTKTEYARLFIASVLSMMMTLVFNGTLYLAYDGIFDWSRDASTATSITLAIVCLVIARKRPRLIRPRVLTCCTIGLSIAGYALCAVGVALKCAPAIVAGVMAVAPIDLWGIILIGLGGKPLSMENARETAKIINEMQPNHLSAMNYTPVEGTKLGNQALRGEFQVLSAKESLMETAELIRNLQVSGMHFTSDHASNYLPLKGTLNEDRDKLLRLIDGAIGGKVAVRSEASRGL